VKFKKFIKFCEKFERFCLNLNFKVLIEKSLKRKRKKRKETPPYLSAQRPTGPLSLSPQQSASPSLLFFFLRSLTLGPHLSAPPSSLSPRPFPSSAPRLCAAAIPAVPGCLLHPSLLSEQAN
jgi:hypothetical protein